MPPGGEPQGTLVVGGLAFHITRLELAGGQLVITACRNGKAPPVSGPVTIFGSDGCGIGQGGTVAIGQVGRWGHAEVTVSIRFERLEDGPAPPL